MFRNIKRNIIVVIIVALPFLNINFVYDKENKRNNLKNKIGYEAEHNRTKVDNELEFELNGEEYYDKE